MTAAGGALAQKWTLTASAGATATYNHYIGRESAAGWIRSLPYGALGIHSGGGGRLKLNGTVGASQFLCTGGQGNSFAPSVALSGEPRGDRKVLLHRRDCERLETFITPFGPQPANLTVQTNNRYISQTYGVSPYIQGVIAPNISYSLRDDNIWTPSSSYGDSSAKTPTTYQNNLNGQMSSVVGHGGGWTLQYTPTGVRQWHRHRYVRHPGCPRHSFLRGGPAADPLGPRRLRKRSLPGLERQPTERYSRRRTIQDRSWRRPQLAADGTDSRSTDSGSTGFSARPTTCQASHRLPNIALSANFTRGLSTFPQLALAIPAGITVAQFLDAAFTTRIPDPAQRAAAVAQFLAQTGLPPNPDQPAELLRAVDHACSRRQSLSAVWVGIRNTLGFTLFNSRSDAISGTGSELPSATQFGASNTQTGGGINYSSSPERAHQPRRQRDRLAGRSRTTRRAP